MSALRTPLVSSKIFSLSVLALSCGALLGTGCVDPAGEFKNFDRRVIDAGMPAVGTGCMGGEIPDVSGEFFLNLDTSIAPGAYLKFIMTQTIDKNRNPAVLSMTLQPLCSQTTCTAGQPAGDPTTLDDTEVDENCDFELDIVDVVMSGEANPISGSELIGNLKMRGNLQSPDFYCGLVDGNADVGTDVSVDGSTFGSVRNTTVGALGDDLPEPVGICPPAE